MRILPLAASAVVGMPAVLAPAQAQEFSADLVATEVAGQPVKTAKLSVTSGKVRFEMPDLPDTFFLITTHPNAAYLVRPAQRVYMDARQSSRVTQLFVTLDPNDPCPQWQAMTKMAGAPNPNTQKDLQWHCQWVANETIEGRNTVRFEAVGDSGRRRSGWIDPLLQFPLKIVAEDGTTFELRNIIEEAEPPDRFEIPRGFIKFDPRQLIERLKQSDVWVEMPH
jgi:hypothetical protein